MNRIVRVHTFGCRLNQTESESLADAFIRSGFRIGGEASLGDAPGIVLINTCTVTSKSEQKARRLIRLAQRENPLAVVIVTGCYAEMESGAIQALGDRVVVVPGSRKDLLLALPASIADSDSGHGDPLDTVREALLALSGGPRDPFAFSPLGFTFHSRASLKVEDGCGNACAYCRVRLARGLAVSLEPEEALRRAQALEGAGYAEIVLTGVNLSQYRSEGLDFSGLLSRLLEGTQRAALRISSYEPDRIDGAFLKAASHPRVRPFFHLPIQSGCGATLARMGRNPDAKALEESIAALRRVKDDPFVSFDMICGFPGESEAEFQESAAFARKARPAWIHVFPYSPRPGTSAASFQDRVPERIAAQRAGILADIARSGRTEYARRWTGRTVEAVLEGELQKDPGSSPAGEAFTENALRVGLYRKEGPASTRLDPGVKKGSPIRILLCAPESADFDVAAFISMDS